MDKMYRLIDPRRKRKLTTAEFNSYRQKLLGYQTDIKSLGTEPTSNIMQAINTDVQIVEKLIGSKTAAYGKATRPKLKAKSLPLAIEGPPGVR